MRRFDPRVLQKDRERCFQRDRKKGKKKGVIEKRAENERSKKKVECL